MSHHPWSPVSAFSRRVIVIAFGLAAVTSPLARAWHQFPASCPSGEVEKVAYPEQYGWFPCPSGGVSCPYNGWVVEFLASHPSPDGACRDLHLVNSTGAGWVLQGGVCTSGGSYVYIPSQMSYCREPRDGFLSVIDRWGNGPGRCWYFRCKDTQQYVLKLTTVSNTAESSTTIRSIEPSQTTSLLARVYNQNNQIVPNVNVRLETDAVPDSGGHRHRTDRPKGSLDGPNPTPHIITGSTGSNGFTFQFKAPEVAGDHKLKATCTDITCTLQGPNTVWVGIKKLIPLPAINSYVLLPNRVS